MHGRWAGNRRKVRRNIDEVLFVPPRPHLVDEFDGLRDSGGDDLLCPLCSSQVTQKAVTDSGGYLCGDEHPGRVDGDGAAHWNGDTAVAPGAGPSSSSSSSEIRWTLSGI